LITRSTENVLYEIDKKPALDLYKEYLGDQSKNLPASGLLFPMQIRSGAPNSPRLVRTILSVDEEAKSLTFAGSIPTGFFAQLMKANFDRLVDGAYQAADEVKRHQKSFGVSDEKPSVCLAVSCVGRRLVLGSRSEEEVEALKESLGKNSSLIGFYSYGELAPSIQGHPCDLHNQSMTLMNICELNETSKP
jgi:hypothetical protein